MKQEFNKPNYYAILTAEVRYDNRLTAMQKLLYAELTALSNTHGFAFPSNDYLATLYGVSEKTIQRNISKLKELGYILIDMENTASGISRKIYINAVILKPKTKLDPPDKSVHTPPDKSVHTHSYNNTRDINTIDIRESNSNMLDIEENFNSEFTLPNIQKIYNENNFKKFNVIRFHNYYSIMNWHLKNGNKIHINIVPKLMEMWEHSEYENKNSNTEVTVNKPDWLDRYIDELEDIKPVNES